MNGFAKTDTLPLSLGPSEERTKIVEMLESEQGTGLRTRSSRYKDEGIKRIYAPAVESALVWRDALGHEACETGETEPVLRRPIARRTSEHGRISRTQPADSRALIPCKSTVQ
jgi:hypothetical protein